MRDPQKARAAKKKYRHSAKGKQRHRVQERRRRRRDPVKAASRIRVLELLGKRIDARRADPVHTPPVASLSETIDLRRRQLWQEAGLLEGAGEHEEANSRYLEARDLKPPTPRVDSSPLVEVSDFLTEALGDIGPHGPPD